MFSIFTLLLITLLVTFKRRRLGNEAGRFLSLYYWAFLLSLSIIFLVQTSYLANVPHLFRTAQFFILLYMPFSYMYFRQSIAPKSLGTIDLIHLLPLVVFTVDYLPFFLLPAAGKLEIWRGLNDYRLNAAFREGWFMPEGSHIVIRYSTMLLYWILQLNLVQRLTKAQSNDRLPANKEQLSWFRWLLGAQAILIFPAILALVFLSKQLQSPLLAFTALISAILQGYFLFTNPGILYGIPEHSENQKDSVPDINAKAIVTNTSYLDQIDEYTLDQVAALLNPLMKEEQLFLNPNLKVADLSAAIGFSAHKLAAYFNKRCGQTFNEYINSLRVNYCAAKLESGEYRAKTLDALSFESGFQSRSTFIRAFKKCKGLTPSEFVQAVKQV